MKSRQVQQNVSARGNAPRAAAGGLRIGATNDQFEQEADRIADSVFTGSFHPSGLSLLKVPAGENVQRKCSCGGTCDKCAGNDRAGKDPEAAPGFTGQRVQRKAGAPRGEESAPAIVHDVLNSGGAPLEVDTRRFFEPRLGHDFSKVRIHTDGRAADSARAVNALAYTVGHHVVFGSGQFAPRSATGRRLLAHELAHTIQQTGGGSARSVTGPVLQRALVTPTAADDVANVAARLEAIIRSGGPIPTGTRVIGAAIIEVEGYSGPVEMRAVSSAATDALGQGASVYHAQTPAGRAFSATRSIAGAGARREFPFSHINDAEMKMFEDIAARLSSGAKGTVHFMTMRVRQVGGRTVLEPYPACSGCTRAAFEMAGFKGITLASHSPVHPTGTLDLSDKPAETEAVGEGKQGGNAPEATPVRVATEITVKNVTRQPNGDVVAEVEYNFGKNLESLNKGAGGAGEIPARMTMRVTQNTEGVITSVESLSGEPHALVEALVRQTLPEALSGGAEGAAAGAAATRAARLATISKGLKIGGWAAFVVITGYQLYKATPEQRPKVLTQAGGGLAGGAIASYLVCNALLDLETAGGGILICGLLVGGAGAVAGSELAGDAYDEATETELGRALKRVDSRSRNERILFNVLLGSLGSGTNCVDARFVDEFLTAVPENLQDYEVILLAGEVGKGAPAARGAAATHSQSLPAAPSGARRSAPCPNCHTSNAESRGVDPGNFDQRRFDEIMAAPSCSDILGPALQRLRAAIGHLPASQRAPGDISHHTRSTAPIMHPDATPPGQFPSEAQQRGTGQQPSGGKSLQDVCPNCHKAITDDPSHNALKDFGGQMTDADKQRMLEYFYGKQH